MPVTKNLNSRARGKQKTAADIPLNDGLNSVPAGVVNAFAGTLAPAGYLLCDGTAVSRTTYAVLFRAIGVAYGAGDGSTTFNLPDCRGMFLRGVSGTSSRDPDAASRTAAATGGNTGNKVGSVQADELRSHAHSINFSRGGHDGDGGGDRDTVSPSGTGTGSTGGNETRPININVNYIIKT